MAQSKVSMVVPCYNKRDYIGAFLESVYNQIWDNIELILVNDGSTDGTREIIAQWELKLKKRGYDVVIIDQENQGVAMAVKNGLLRITGDYICAPDCDDELYPDYVSAMAEHLELHPEHNFCICGFDAFLMKQGIINGPAEHRSDSSDAAALTLDDFALAGFCRAVWRYFVRRNFFNRLKIAENIPKTKQRITHEAYIGIPLLAAGGYGYVEKALYKYRLEIPAITNMESYDKRVHYENVYFEAVKYTLGTLQISESEKARILALAELYRDFGIMQGAFNLAADTRTIKQFVSGMEQCVNKRFVIGDDASILSSGTLERLFMEQKLPSELLLEAIRHAVRYPADAEMEVPDLTFTRVIGYGAKGTVAKNYVPRLMRTTLEPTVLWDQGAEEGDELCGLSITKPMLDTLSEEDVLLIFPKSSEIITEIKGFLRRSGITTRVFFHDDIRKMLPVLHFPQFYGECRFIPKKA